MAILQKLGAAIKTLLGSSHTASAADTVAASVDKTELLSMIETQAGFAALIKHTLQQPAVLEALGFLRQSGVKDITPESLKLQKIYQMYFHALPARWQQAERNAVFAAIAATTESIDADLALLRENFADLFGGVDTAELPVKELTITSAAVLGWLTIIEQYFVWVVYFINNIPTPDAHTPPYQLLMLGAKVEDIAHFTVLVLSRPMNETLLAVLESVRRAGSDLHLITDGHTVDSYASDAQYSPVVVTALSGFNIRNPILIIGNMVNQYRQFRYERDKARRAWLASKIGYLTLQAQGLDPDSAEAKRLAMIITRYADMVSQYDQKLGINYDE